ncbi:nitrile hydratase accessory protein [Zavarzinia sp. CC-PAN008]|uniref:nitrile hydratase accessory protein n=1 Tax=Zavarzinia sp. CC-PAN008 TaxID=3243332 RepID=UPI003F745AB2
MSLEAVAAALDRPEALDGVAFAEPWAARAFGLTLALAEAGLFTLKDFQQALIDDIGAYEKAGCIADETTYYTRWIGALAALLRARDLLPEDRLQALEAHLAAEAEARRQHQHHVARNPDGSLRVGPLAVG